jgi:diadenosine tetraphosphatase ApaH/serine/threonine PP2A family protein phosphatase
VTKSGDPERFDFIGDVHGCIDELTALLTKLGYEPFAGNSMSHPDGRRAFFLGDLSNRGPDTPGVLGLAMAMLASGDALAVPGNHDIFLLQALTGRVPGDPDAVQSSLMQLGDHDALKQDVVAFIESLPVHQLLDNGSLVAAHAGLPEALQGLDTPEARHFAVFGERPDRDKWARDYRGARKVVHGHLPTEQPQWLNGTLDIDTGCVYGGRLTALRYPELELVAVPAAEVYFESRRTPALRAAAQAYSY